MQYNLRLSFRLEYTDLHDALGEGLGDDLEEHRVLVVLVVFDALHHGSRHVVEVPCGDLYREKDQHRQPVERVVHCIEGKTGFQRRECSADLQISE